MPQKLTRFSVKKVSLVSWGANDEEFQRIQKSADETVTLFKSAKEIDKMVTKEPIAVEKEAVEVPTEAEVVTEKAFPPKKPEEEKPEGVVESPEEEEVETPEEEAEEEKEEEEVLEEKKAKKAKKAAMKKAAPEVVEKSAEERIVDLQKALTAKDAELQAVAASVESVKKNAETQEKVAKEATERLARLEDVAKTSAIHDEVKATMSGIVGITTDELTSVLKAASERQLTTEEIASIRKAFVATSVVVVKSAAFGEIGTSNEVKVASPLEQANAFADAQVAKSGDNNPDMKASARAQFWDEHPDVYKAYLKGGN